MTEVNQLWNELNISIKQLWRKQWRHHPAQFRCHPMVSVMSNQQYCRILSQL